MKGLLLFSFTLFAQQSDIIYGRLRFRVAPPERYLEAETEWHFRFVFGDTLVWDLGSGLTIEAIEASRPIRSLLHDTLHRKVYISLTDPLHGEHAWLRVRYSGIPRSSGFGSYEVKPHATGWCVWTLSQPYGAPDWLFCQDKLGDKIDSLDICIITPDTLLGVANGKLLADTTDGQGWRWRHFQHRYPIAPYLIAFAASNYIVQEYPVQTAHHQFILRNYVYPQDTDAARELSERFLPYFQRLEEWIGPYPFASEDYQQVQIGWGGGMEHQTITFFGRYSLELWAHELAHQWFGDWVTCGSWQDIWLNEAFATYLGGAVYEALAPEFWHRWLYLTIQAAWRDTTHSIFVEDTTQIKRIFSYATTYAKGAIALHMLRLYVGDSLFWKGLRQYLLTYGGGFARTHDFQQAVQDVFGSSITEAFILNWIYESHFPQAAVDWEDEKRCRVYPTAAYPMRVPIQILTESGVVRETIDFMHGRQLLELQSRALSWTIDPDTTTPYWGWRSGTVAWKEGRLWPNPFSQRVFLQMKGLCRAELYSTSGRLIEVYKREPQDEPLMWELPNL
ncbi:MAG: M1 family metallopeptidase, partial [Bacteroidia bacterium]|nr:M1 family metallopeptidase [Bacteroidia bacterium]